MKVKADGFVGSIMAIESIQDARALLHGPAGCRKTVVSQSRLLYPRDAPGTGMEYYLPYFNGMPRIPCTNIVVDDYISGAFEKIEDALKVVEGKGDNLIAIVSSPGASLIGDDTDEVIAKCNMEGRAISLDAELISKPLGYGMDLTICKVMDWLSPEKTETRKGTVNILGLTILSKDWQTVREELDEIMGAMDLEIICHPLGGCTLDDLRESVNASLNIVISPEYSINTAGYYENKYGIPYVVNSDGAPVGFEATESWIKLIAEKTGKNPDKALAILKNYKLRAQRCVKSSGMAMRMRGESFSIEGDASTVYPMVKWLYDYLSMIPESIQLNYGSDKTCEESLKSFLEEIDCSDSLGKEHPDFVELYINDGNTAVLRQRSGHCRVGLDIGYPSLVAVDFIPRPVLGMRGSMYILDEILNTR